MKVTGFTFIRNAIIYDYPVMEAILSVLPLCDDFVVAVGKSEDETLALISQIDPNKIRIIETVWDDSLREGGQVLAIETDKAYNAIADDTDWAFYIQGDEVLHEKYHEPIKKAMLKWKDHSGVDGLLFDYLHFYGSYDYVGISDSWYPHEIRVIRKTGKIYSYRDAQGFRKENNCKLNVKSANACMYHYGWVKEPVAMERKQESFNKIWHQDQWIEKNVSKSDAFDYSGIDALNIFEGTHPAVMNDRIKKKNWKFDYDLSYNNLSFKSRLKSGLRKYLGIETGYKNYRKI